MITAKQIADAKLETDYIDSDHHHEHDDCIRIAYEWLDAQIKTKHAAKRHRALKHIIETWGGRYVSQSDVEVAAQLHSHIKGKYPFYNISARLTLPSFDRLNDIPEANTHSYRDHLDKRTYSKKE